MSSFLLKELAPPMARSGRIVVRTKISHGAKEVRQPILVLIGKQLRLDRIEFESLLNGQLSRERYGGILRKQGVID